MAGREAPGAGRTFAGQAQPDRAGVRRARPVCGEVMREREEGERKGGPGYYTRLCSSDRYISRRTYVGWPTW
jgi:hypothetical protein